MQRLIAASLAVVVTGLVAASAQAAPISYSILGNCDGTCANAGMSRGDLAFGTLTLNRDEIVVGGSFDESDLVSFSLTFAGNTISNATAAGASLLGVWGDDLTTIAAIDLRAASAVSPASGLGIVLMLGGSIVSTSASCATAACDSVSWTSAATLSGVSLRERGDPGPAPVPLPPAAALALTGMAGLAFAARRRRPDRPEA